MGLGLCWLRLLCWLCHLLWCRRCGSRWRFRCRWSGWGCGSADVELAGVVAQECAFDHGDDECLFVGWEVVEGFHAEAEVLCLWAALGVAEDEGVGGDGEGDGDGAENVEGGLVGAGFVAAELGDVDADAVGEDLLGEAGGLACAGEAGGEVHGSRGGE